MPCFLHKLLGHLACYTDTGLDRYDEDDDEEGDEDDDEEEDEEDEDGEGEDEPEDAGKPLQF
jgi:hypothetical protein